MKRGLKNLLLGILVILLVVFVTQNLPTLMRGETFRLNLLLASWQTPHIETVLLFALCFLAGYLTAWVLGFKERRRLSARIKGLTSLQSRTEEELTALRNLPILGEAKVMETPRTRKKGG